MKLKITAKTEKLFKRSVFLTKLKFGRTNQGYSEPGKKSLPLNNFLSFF